MEVSGQLHTPVPFTEAEGYWVRHDATSQKVVGSSPDEVDFF
jgi:hypothetical protein